MLTTAPSSTDFFANYWTVLSVVIFLLDNSETPLNKQLKKPQTVFSPPTPHRIQLCSDSDEATNTDELAQPEKPPQPKAKKRLNVLQNGDSGSHKLTEYFPVRRSVRKTKKTVLEEKQRSLENVLRLDIEEGLIVSGFLLLRESLVRKTSVFRYKISMVKAEAW